MNKHTGSSFEDFYIESLKQEILDLQAEAEKLIAALEFMTMPITAKEHTVESLLETIKADDERGIKALEEYRSKFPRVKNEINISR